MSGTSSRSEGGPDDTVIRPVTAFAVTVWPGRLELPALGGAPIGRPQLELIATYAAGAHPTIASAALEATGDAMDAEFHEWSTRLLRRRALVHTEHTEHAEHVERVELPPAPTSTPADRAPPGEVQLVLDTPLSLRSHGREFEVVGHHGDVLVRLSIDDVLALPGLASAPGAPGPGELCDRLVVAGVMRAADPEGQVLPRLAPEDTRERVRRAFARAAQEADRREQERVQRTGVVRTKVVPVSFTSGPPLALGLIYAHCVHHHGGVLADRYDFRTDWEWDDARLDDYTSHPAIYLCSAYVWSHVEVLAVATAVKERCPASLVVIGGPDVPKRAPDAETYLLEHPEVDVVVRGEGEQTALELLAAVAGGTEGFDLSGLVDVPGLTVRAERVGAGADARVVRTPDRERLTDLDVVPSPFLTGLFDTYLDAPLDQVILETNRGCPYGCTFCDWGSATQSRIRSFDLDRVFGEIEWSARGRAAVVSLADANFGIFSRDVSIAEKITTVRAETSYPRGFGANFAKNTVKHLGPIIRTLVDGGIVNRGLLALQTTDQETLDTIERSNIKVERYDAIAKEMRAARLPFAVELMMGLPGATVESFKQDLQQCIDREVEGTVNPTTVLVNSPMNDPAYRERHEIRTAREVTPGSHALVVSTASFTREDYATMNAIRKAFLIGENFGVTRHVDRLVRHTTGRREVEFLAQLQVDVVGHPDQPERYPYLRAVFGQPHQALLVPISWRYLVDELVAYVQEVAPEIDPGALATVATVQHAVLPALDRTYPEVIELDHDYAAWFAAMVQAKEDGHGHDWPEHVPPLHAYGPGLLHVDDPNRSARNNIGCSFNHGPLLASWEHRSEVGRALFWNDPAA